MVRYCFITTQIMSGSSVRSYAVLIALIMMSMSFAQPVHVQHVCRNGIHVHTTAAASRMNGATLQLKCGRKPRRMRATGDDEDEVASSSHQYMQPVEEELPEALQGVPCITCTHRLSSCKSHHATHHATITRAAERRKFCPNLNH